MHRLLRSSIAAIAVLAAAAPLGAQDRGAPQLDQLVRGLATTARVLVIAAHPDDEDTQAIAWLARGKHVETAYLSLTRGDGGQNLIGNELGESLGIIRTEELLAARRVDGGRQFFTRAFDFGFSKNAEETMKHWPKDTILGDVVTVIRAFRPHVIYSVWSGTRADGHGHHEMAGILAREAFDAAADTVRFSVRKYGEPWAPSKFYNRGNSIVLPVNDFDAVQGRTYREMAIDSRSQHRSQGFADVALLSMVPGSGGRGGIFSFGGAVTRTATRVNENVDPKAEKSIFDGIDTTFARLFASAPPSQRPFLAQIQSRADSALALLDYRDPSRAAPVLARLAAAVQQMRSQIQRCHQRIQGALLANPRIARCLSGELDFDASLETLERRTSEALLAAVELKVEARAQREFLAFGDSTPVTIDVVNRGRLPIGIVSISMTGGPRSGFTEVTLRPDSGYSVTQSIIGLPDARPWWIAGEREDGYFGARMSPFDGIARVSNAGGTVPGAGVSEETRRLSAVKLIIDVGGTTAVVDAGPVVYRTADPLIGTQNRPLIGVPSVTLEFDRNLEWIPAGKAIDRFLRLTVRSFSDQPQTFSFRSLVPEGLKIDSLPAQMTIGPGNQQEIFIRVRGTLKPGRYPFGVAGEFANGAKFADGFSPIIYPHIRPIYKYRTSAMYMQAVEIEVPQRLSVAYIQGVGDDNAIYLRQLGIPVSVIQAAELPQWDLARFTTVVVGPRAAEANRVVLTQAKRLMDFARSGGTLVVQYGQQGATTPQLFPFPLEWSQPANRVTVEDGPVTVLDAKSRLLTYPNKIGPDDWRDWVQERSLYMPSKVDSRYQAPLEMHDPDEAENKSAILTTPLGRGMYVYTSLALFRQLPNAVPGSARLFVNLLSAGVQPSARTVP